MLLLLEDMIFLYIHAKSHWKYYTFEGYYICSFSKLRHKAHQKLWTCSLTFHLQNGIVTFYEYCTCHHPRSWWSTFQLSSPL